MVVNPTDRVLDVIRQDEGMVEVLASITPAMARLRDPSMRKVMSSLVTVEDVARMAGLDPNALASRLSRSDASMNQANTPGAASGPESLSWPAALRRIPEARVIRLDVREDLRQGREPFSRIMEARRGIPVGGALCLRAIFEPVPLYAVMERQGFAHFTERISDDDWQVWFYPESADASVDTDQPSSQDIREPETEDGRDDVRVLDVRGLEPPEPMVRTLAELEGLPDGHTLVQINVRVPQFLFPLLDERGFTYEVREQSSDLVRVFIRRPV